MKHREHLNIVIEGPKGTGKSTLINRLRAALDPMELDYRITHLTKETGGSYELMEKLLEKETGIDLNIFDRFHISEIVYTNATPGRELRFSKEEFENLSKEVDLIILLLTEDSETLIERIVDRDGMISDLDRTIIEETVKGFNELDFQDRRIFGLDTEILIINQKDLKDGSTDQLQEEKLEDILSFIKLRRQ